MNSSLLENLNPEQLAAVTLPHSSALILAGAGSGKTRVLTTRIAWLLATGQATPLSILAVTFTNNAAKEDGLRPNDVGAGDEFTRRQVEHDALYEAACEREGVVDFPELLLRSYELLSRNDMLRDHYRRRFSHILVDEFQDTNALQYRWLKQLTGPDTAVFAVGDDDQSIYAFRGANIANMQHFERDFGTAAAAVRLIKLEQNYRSHRLILDAANALIKHNQQRLGKNLWTSEGKGEPVRAFSAQSDVEEAAFVVDVV